MTFTTKRLPTYGAIILALGIAAGCYAGCRLGAVHSLSTVVIPKVEKPVETPISESQVTVHTEYLPGKPYPKLVHDTEYAPIPGEWRVDTIRETNEHTVYVPKPVHDTVVKVVHSNTHALFQASANVEHDLFSGYGAQLELRHNLDWLGLRNYAVYISGGVTRGLTSHGEARGALGVEIPLGEWP
jgi:hypothetical protein